jgi:hypothetical protein
MACLKPSPRLSRARRCADRQDVIRLEGVRSLVCIQSGPQNPSKESAMTMPPLSGKEHTEPTRPRPASRKRLAGGLDAGKTDRPAPFAAQVPPTAGLLLDLKRTSSRSWCRCAFAHIHAHRMVVRQSHTGFGCPSGYHVELEHNEGVDP